MRKLLTTLTALTLIGGVLLGAPARTLAVGGSAVYWISTASVGAGTSCASPTHQYDATNANKHFNDLLDDILTDVAEEEYASATIAICDADGGAQQVYEMDADTDPEIDVEGVEITIAGVLWDATSEADVAGAGDVVIDGMNTFDEEGAAVGGYSPFEFNNADVYIGYLTIRDAFDDVAGAAIHFEQDDPEFIYELNLDHVVIDGAWINGGNGAGVYAEGSVTITDSTFTDNRADGGNGGAIYASAGVELATLTISNSQFYDSSASGSGGAIYTPAEIVFFESLTIESNKFQRNTAGSQGGAIRVSRGTSGTSITRNTFTENSAEQGGAVSINDGEDDSYLWSISRNTFAKNRATLNGGALHMALDNSGNVVAPNVKRNGFKRNSAPAAGAVVVESDYGTGRAILRRYERGLRGNSFQANRATSERRSANIGVHFD